MAASYPEVLIVYGDLVFNQYAIKNLRGSSKVVVDTNNFFKKEEVGVVLSHNNYVTNMSFGIDTKWAQIAYLSGKELNLFKNISTKKECCHWFGYEGLNYVIENGGRIECYRHKLMKIFEIDAARDLEKRIDIWVVWLIQ